MHISTHARHCITHAGSVCSLTTLTSLFVHIHPVLLFIVGSQRIRRFSPSQGDRFIICSPLPVSHVYLNYLIPRDKIEARGRNGSRNSASAEGDDIRFKLVSKPYPRVNDSPMS